MVKEMVPGAAFASLGRTKLQMSVLRSSTQAILLQVLLQ
jgi:hypothetical protein